MDTANLSTPSSSLYKSKGPIHSQLLGGRDGQVSGGMTACLLIDVLVDVVGPRLVDRTRSEKPRELEDVTTLTNIFQDNW